MDGRAARIDAVVNQDATIEALRDRYARGTIDLARFETLVERVLHGDTSIGYRQERKLLHGMPGEMAYIGIVWRDGDAE
jgi:hypothetical protein